MCVFPPNVYFVWQMIFRMMPGALGEEPVRLIYPELLKRLDDSNDAVRRAVCGTMSVFFRVSREIFLLEQQKALPQERGWPASISAELWSRHDFSLERGQLGKLA